MKVLNVIDEDIVNYKKISMYIAFPTCSMKCNIDASKSVCQNEQLTSDTCIEYDGESLVNRYLANPLTHAVVFGGLEPFDSPFSILPFVNSLRNKHNCHDDIVIYTGYTEGELEGRDLYSYPNAIPQVALKDVYKSLKRFDNIIVKFGRYIPNDKPHKDPVLGVMLASDNQYAKLISEVNNGNINSNGN